METKTTVLHTEHKVSKNGNKYVIYHVLIEIGASQFVRKLYEWK